MNKLSATVLTAAMLLGTVIPTALAQTTSHATTAAAVDAKGQADQYLKANAAKYNLQADLADLQHVTTIETVAGTYVRYQQTVGGAPAFAQQLTVTFDRSGEALLVVSEYQPVTSVKQAKNKIGKEKAVEKTIQYLAAKNSKWAETTTEFGYTIENGEAIPVYKVIFHAEEPFGAWEVMLDAEQGKLMKKRNLNMHVTGSGQVFMPNPISSAGTKTGFVDNNDADSTALTNQLASVSIQGLDGSGYLVGQYVNIYSRIKTYSATNTFNFTRADDRFEDVNVYYHIDTLQRYIQSLGFNNINNRSLKANVNTYKQDNSYYSPSTKELTFGTGGVDDGEDAGIIAHEYGHSIQDNQVPGFGSSAQAGAMGEGFGDFLGATYEDAVSNNTFGKACVGEWDALSYSSTTPPCLRRLDKNKVYPTNFVGQVHSDGEIWSQGLYDMAATFGRDTATKLVLQSHWSLTPGATFNDGARAIKQADMLLFGGANGAQIDAIFAARGLSTN